MSEDPDERWLRRAIELAHHCPPSPTAYSVGAVIVAADGIELATGHSREGDPAVHAEESALAKPPPGDLAGATIYSSLEPCAQRASRPRPCARLIVEAGLLRVVFAWREPTRFVAEPQGVAWLRRAGVEVRELPGLAAEAMAPNAHLTR